MLLYTTGTELYSASSLASSQFSVLYLVSLVVILIGFVAFNVTPTPPDVTADHAATSSSEVAEYDNPVIIPDCGDIITTDQEVSIQIAPPGEAEREEGQMERRRGEDERRRVVLGHGTRM